MPQYIDRKGTSCAKWDGLEQTFGEDGLLPFWVADMDFKVDSHIEAALKEYIETAAYGYYMASGSYYDAGRLGDRYYACILSVHARS